MATCTWWTLHALAHKRRTCSPRLRFHVRLRYAHVRFLLAGSKGPQKTAISAVLSRSKTWLGVEDDHRCHDDVHVGRLREMVRGKQLTDMATTQKINLSVLQRMDPDVVDVLAKAGHVTLYDFDTATKTWARKQVEGALFVVQRCVETDAKDAEREIRGSKKDVADR